MKRRTLLSLIPGIPFLTHLSSVNNVIDRIVPPNDNSHIVFPPPLKTGDGVAFTAPASPTSMGNISEYVRFFKSKNCNVIIGDTIKKQKNEHRYLSHDDEVRAEEFNSFIYDSNVRAIICGRGGFGVTRMLHLLDYNALMKDPKIIMGYSDITALLLAIYRRSNVTGFHGPVGSSKLLASHRNNMDNLFFEQSPIICYKTNDMQVLGKSKAKVFSGKLQGGNLTLIGSTMGTPYEIDLRDSILFFEDVSEASYTIDRLLSSLMLANKLKDCSGIIVGKMKKFDHRPNFYPNKGYTIKEVIEHYANKLDIPCICNISFGHVNSEVIFPLGACADVDINKKEIVVHKNNNFTI